MLNIKKNSILSIVDCNSLDTEEIDTDNVLSVLDVTTIADKNSYKTRWYRHILAKISKFLNILNILSHK
jgi:hypothetical protein